MRIARIRQATTPKIKMEGVYSAKFLKRWLRLLITLNIKERFNETRLEKLSFLERVRTLTDLKLEIELGALVHE